MKTKHLKKLQWLLKQLLSLIALTQCATQNQWGHCNHTSSEQCMSDVAIDCARNAKARQLQIEVYHHE